MNAKTEFIAISSQPLSKGIERDTSKIFLEFGVLGKELFEILEIKNGFYAFDSSFHIYPTITSENEYSIEEWNSDLLWKNAYGALIGKILFFAEDIFGTQFCLFNEQIYIFDPETAHIEKMAKSFEEFFTIILNDKDYYTGHSLAKEWQGKYGSIGTGHHLIPRTPFILGGEYLIDNLIRYERVKSMKVRGQLANLLKDMPDGTKISFVITE